jgi:hypothetical protein
MREGNNPMFKVLVNGVEIQCESVDDAIAIARRLGGGSGPAPGGTNGARATDDGSRWTETRFRTFTTGLRELQAKMLRELILNPDGVPDATLRRALNLDSNKALGASMGGLSKKAKKLGIGLDDILKSEKLMLNGEEVLEFKIAPAFLKIAKASGWK